MQTHLKDYSDLTARDLDAWAAVRARRSEWANPFFNPAFAETVATVRKDVRVLHIRTAAGSESFWPLHIRPGGFARPVGAPLSDQQGPVYEPDDVPDFPAALASIGVRGVRADGLAPSAEAVGMTEVEAINTQIADMSAGFDAYIAAIRKENGRYTKNMRRKRRNFETDLGAPVLIFGERDKAVVDWIVLAKRQQYQRTAKHDIFGARWTVELLHRLVLRDGAFRAVVSDVRGGETRVAGEINLVDGDYVHSWITAYDPDYSQYSPGIIGLEETMAALSANGVKTFDFGVGHAHYKKYYVSYERPVHAGLVQAPNATLNLAGAGGALWRRIEHDAPERIAALAQRARRRLDQISACDLSAGARVRGMLAALRPPAEA